MSSRHSTGSVSRLTVLSLRHMPRNAPKVPLQNAIQTYSLGRNEFAQEAETSPWPPPKIRHLGDRGRLIGRLQLCLAVAHITLYVTRFDRKENSRIRFVVVVLNRSMEAATGSAPVTPSLQQKVAYYLPTPPKVVAKPPIGGQGFAPSVG